VSVRKSEAALNASQAHKILLFSTFSTGSRAACRALPEADNPHLYTSNAIRKE